MITNSTIKKIGIILIRFRIESTDEQGFCNGIDLMFFGAMDDAWHVSYDAKYMPFRMKSKTKPGK